MVEFFVCDNLDNTELFEKLRQRRGNGKKSMLIVPDRFMLYYEKAVMSNLGIESCFDIEVVSFSRLANKTMGTKMNDYLSAQGTVMLLRKVIEKNKDKLACFRGSYSNAEFANEIYAVISQIRNSGVSTDQIEAILPELPLKILNKSKDIVMLYKGYVQELSERYCDGSSKLEALIEAIDEKGMEDCDVYISDYLYLSNVQRRICEKIFARANYCAVFMVANKEAENSRIYPQKYIDVLVERAEKCNLVPHINYVGSRLTGDKAVMAKHLFAYGGKTFDSDGSTRIFVADSYEQEVKRIARDIKSKVAEQGYRFMDFAVVCCDSAIYPPIVERVFTNAGISYFCDKKQSLATQAASRLMLGAMRTVARGFRRKDVTELCKNVILGLDYSKVCNFENFCIKFGIDNSRLLSPFTVGEDDERFADAEQIRAFAAGALSCFCDKNSAAQKFAAQLEDFLRYTDFDAKYAVYTQKLRELGLDTQYNCAVQAIEKLRDLTKQSVTLLGDEQLSLSGYLNILSSAVASEQISLVPLYTDCVFVGEARESRYDGVKYMYVVGANEGKLPPEHGDNGIFAGKESKEWEKHGVIIEPDAREQNNAERLNTLMFMLKPTQCLQISYSRYSDSGQPLSESVVIKQLKELLNIKVEKESRPSALWETGDYARYFAGEDNAVEELLQYKLLKESGIRHFDDSQYDSLYSIACAKHGEDFVDAVLDGNGEDLTYIDTKRASVWKKGHTSASQIEKYLKCPFMHYMDYAVKVKPQEKAEIKVSDLGSIIHEVLQIFFKENNFREILKTQVAQKVKGILAQVFKKEEYRGILAIPRLKGERKEIEQRCIFLIGELCERMKNGDFEPYVLEEAFGMDGSFAPVKIALKDKTLELLGRIDRIDRYGDYITIIDYKSASTISFSLSQVIFGERIQLFVYMKALSENGGFKPAGVFYLPVNNKFLSEEKADGRFKFIGFVNTDSEILPHFDHTLDSMEEGKESALYPIKVKTDKKTGVTDVVSSSDGVAADTATFAKVCDYVDKLTVKAAQEIDDGFIKPSPRKGSCEYCDYRDVCRFKENESAVRKLSGKNAFSAYAFFNNDGEGKDCE